jgi:hypothetical protein
MDVLVWLRSLGLQKYEAAFRENDIDETVLPSLTHENLKELGVSSLGHRVKLLDAIAALRNEASGKTPSVGAATTSSAPSAYSEDRAERRQVTVMFSDLVGSTALSGRMDPEDLREVISAYQKCVAETVQRFGGFVAKYMGDGVLIYFGYPQAYEDDAERAVRARRFLSSTSDAAGFRFPLLAQQVQSAHLRAWLRSGFRLKRVEAQPKPSQAPKCPSDPVLQGPQGRTDCQGAYRYFQQSR